MSLTIKLFDHFAREAKRLSKRYRGLKNDIAALQIALQENPHLGVEIIPHVRKVRMPISAKGKGKSGGARVLTYDVLVKENEGELFLLYIYDKSEMDSPRDTFVKWLVEQLQADLTQ